MSGKRGNLAAISSPPLMGPARPTSLKEEATINLYISHAHCSAATPTTTYTVAPRGEAQTHLSNTKMKPPLPALSKSKYKYLVVQQQPPSQSGTDKCKALVQRASLFTCVCVLS